MSPLPWKHVRTATSSLPTGAVPSFTVQAANRFLVVGKSARHCTGKQGTRNNAPNSGIRGSAGAAGYTSSSRNTRPLKNKKDSCYASGKMIAQTSQVPGPWKGALSTHALDEGHILLLQALPYRALEERGAPSVLRFCRSEKAEYVSYYEVNSYPKPTYLPACLH